MYVCVFTLAVWQIGRFHSRPLNLFSGRVYAPIQPGKGLDSNVLAVGVTLGNEDASRRHSRFTRLVLQNLPLMLAGCE